MWEHEYAFMRMNCLYLCWKKLLETWVNNAYIIFGVSSHQIFGVIVYSFMYHLYLYCLTLEERELMILLKLYFRHIATYIFGKINKQLVFFCCSNLLQKKNTFFVLCRFTWKNDISFNLELCYLRRYQNYSLMCFCNTFETKIEIFSVLLICRIFFSYMVFSSIWTVKSLLKH